MFNRENANETLLKKAGKAVKLGSLGSLFLYDPEFYRKTRLQHY